MDHTSNDQRPLSYNEKFVKLLTNYVNQTAPRRFALCRKYCFDAEDWVYAWGAALPDNAVLFRYNGKLIGTFNTAESALRACLTWIVGGFLP
jgi:hypothetical protein